jgi:hypothetical protein
MSSSPAIPLPSSPISSSPATPQTQPEDQYLVGDWNGDGKDNLAVRRSNWVLMDFNFGWSPYVKDR